MTALSLIWTFLTGNKLARMIGGAVAVVLAVLTFGAVKKREGSKEAEARHEAEKAKDFRDTIEKVSHETISNDPADAIRRRMRERGQRKP